MIAARSLWEAVAPNVGRAACLLGTNGHHAGVITGLFLEADGSGQVRFADGVTVTVPPLRTCR